MLTVLLVDDEVNIIEMLNRLIDWEGLDLKLLGTAYNGHKALQIILEQHPDIVITDIRMPDLDGLALLQQVREKNINSQFIILSGYRHFEYAQNAIRYGVKEYLLKPISKTALNLALKHSIADIKKTGTLIENNLQMNLQLSSLKVKMNDVLLDEIIHNQPTVQEPLTVINQNYMMSFQEASFQFFIYKLDYHERDAVFHQNLMNKVSIICEQAFTPLCQQLLIGKKGHNIVLLLNYESSQWPEIRLQLNATFHQICMSFSQFAMIQLTIGVGSVQNKLSAASLSYSHALAALKQRIITGTQRIIFYKKPKQILEVKNIFASTAMHELNTAIENFDLPQMRKQVNDIITLAESFQIDDACFYWALIKEILYFFWSTLHRMRLCEEINYEKQYQALCEKLDHCTSISSLRLTFIDYLVKQFRQCYDFDNPPVNVAITSAKKYISNHYSEKLTLEKVAKYVYLNPIYFSICFKKETGMNFITYLNEYRISVAKELLKDNKYNISEISEMCGFSNSQYFAKSFKKYTGLQPNEYRKKYVEINSSQE